MTTHNAPAVPPVGSFLDTLIEGERQAQPRISEYQFEREVLGILENPFGPEALMRYLPYVGEMTKPLHVVANDNRDDILFTVPALAQYPIPTMATGRSGLTAHQFLQSLTREIDLGGRHYHDKVTSFMSQITKTPDYYQNVIVPIQEILGRYGRKMVTPATEQEGQAVADTAPTTTGTTTFSDEYED